MTEPIFSHARLIDVEGEPLVVRIWTPGVEGSRDFAIDLPSFFTLAEEVMRAWLRRLRWKF